MARLQARQQRRDRFWAGAATVAVIALFVCLFTFDLGVYLWVVNLGMLGWALIVLGVPILLWAAWSEKSWIRKDTAGQVLALGGAAFLLLIAGTALLDAERFQFNNCWQIRSSEAEGEVTEIVECVPGSEPKAGSWYSSSSDSGGFRDCEYLETSSSGGTIWRCVSGDL